MSIGTIVVKETVFDGYRMRSRREARRAVFIKDLGLPYEYEPQDYVLPGVGRYLPDFYLRGLGLWIEVKPKRPTFNDATWKRASGLRDVTGQPVIICHEVPTLGEPVVGFWNEIGDSSGGPSHDTAHWAICRACGRVTVTLGDATHLVVSGEGWGAWRSRPCCNEPKNWNTKHPRLQRAADAARSARFEHGEHGAR